MSNQLKTNSDSMKSFLETKQIMPHETDILSYYQYHSCKSASSRRGYISTGSGFSDRTFSDNPSMERYGVDVTPDEVYEVQSTFDKLSNRNFPKMPTYYDAVSQKLSSFQDSRTRTFGSDHSSQPPQQVSKPKQVSQSTQQVKKSSRGPQSSKRVAQRSQRVSPSFQQILFPSPYCHGCCCLCYCHWSHPNVILPSHMISKQPIRDERYGTRNKFYTRPKDHSLRFSELSENDEIEYLGRKEDESTLWHTNYAFQDQDLQTVLLNRAPTNFKEAKVEAMAKNKQLHDRRRSPKFSEKDATAATDLMKDQQQLDTVYVNEVDKKFSNACKRERNDTVSNRDNEKPRRPNA